MPGDADIEWLDLEPLSPPRPDVIRIGRRVPAPGSGPGGPGRRTRPNWPGWHWWYALVALAVLGGILVITRPTSHPASAGGRPSSSASPTATPGGLSGPSAAQSAQASAAALAAAGSGGATGSVGSVTTTSAGAPLLDVPADWELFGRGSSAVVDLRLAAGQVISTEIPLMSSSGSASFVEGPDRVILLPLNVLQGYVIPNGKSFQPLAATFPLTGPAMPGPDPDDLWVPGTADSTMALVAFDGNPTGVTVAVPADAATVMTDYAGYMTFTGTGGVYDLRPGAIQRITTGSLLAAGPTTWLTEECDDQFHCSPTVIDRATGSRHTINVPADSLMAGGVISPDGTTAAVLEGNVGTFDGEYSTGDSPDTLHLIDLATGTDRATTMTIEPNQNFQPGLFIWSPDNRWVFATNATGRLYAINAAANQTTTLNVTLGPVSQLALRTAAG